MDEDVIENEYQVMKTDPKRLFDYYINRMQQGIPLDDSQIVKMEYVKSVLFKG